MDRLRHRGPDDAGSFRAQARDLHVTLCATRLAIRDLSSRGHQPMVAPRSGCAIAFNGELYNADELRRQLEPTWPFRGGSDTEVALAAYESWGPRACAAFRGMFALAVWNPREASLLLARDPLGIKPLYYRHESGSTAFASELRALTASGPAPRLDRKAFGRYLATGALEEPDTILEGVRMLPPGSTLTASAGRVEHKRFWALEDQFSDRLPIDRREALERVRAALEASVRRQLVSDAPLGVFLSGGIDSSALVGLTATVDRPPVTTSVVFAEGEYSEAPYIEAVRGRWSTDHRQVELSANDFLARLPASLAAMDQPTFDGVNTHVVSELAREAGLTVALSGLGGDELFAGYELFRTVPQLETARRLLPRLPARLALAMARTRYRDGDRGRKLGRWLAGEVPTAYALQREVIDPASRLALIGTAEDGGGERPARDVNAISYLELSRYMGNVLLRDADVMSMAHGLEVRVPLLDQELVELVARIPPEHKVARGREKPLLVDAVRDLLPEAVTHRPKMGFTLPFHRWLRGELREAVADVLLDPSFGGQVAQALEPSAVVEVWRQFEGGRTGWSRPWALYVAKVWGERHL